MAATLITVPALIEKYVRSGKVRYVFRDSPIAALHPCDEKGQIAAACVAEQRAARFWKMHDELFRSQGEWNRLPNHAEFLANAAKKSGADMPAYENCVASGNKAEAPRTGLAPPADACGLGRSARGESSGLPYLSFETVTLAVAVAAPSVMV